MASLQKTLPWTKSPLVINAPMGGFAGHSLATEVTKAGGLGMIGATFMDDLRSQLPKAASALQSQGSTLPIGVGLLIFILKLEDVVPVIAEFKPKVLWLFASKTFEDYATWAQKLREVSPESQIWIQCGSVSAAVEIAKTAEPDVLVLQGADAGGHGFEKGAGIISLLPEAADTLAREGFGQISLVTSGGIVDGRGIAASLALGAKGVVIGTRFLAAKEVQVHPKYQKAILEAKDGGQATTRSKLFDNLRGPNIWPELYDGRSLVVQSYADHINGMDIEEIRKLHNEAVEAEDKGFASEYKGRAAIWAGTGVGLVDKVEAAADIVESARKQARDILGHIANIM